MSRACCHEIRFRKIFTPSRARRQRPCGKNALHKGHSAPELGKGELNSSRTASRARALGDEITSPVDESDVRRQGQRVDQIGEGNVPELELTADADHVTVQVLLGERAISPEAELTAEDYIEGVRSRTPRFVTELHPSDFLASAHALEVTLRNVVAARSANVQLRERDVARLVPVLVHVGLRQHLGEPFRQHHGAVLLAPEPSPGRSPSAEPAEAPDGRARGLRELAAPGRDSGLAAFSQFDSPWHWHHADAPGDPRRR
jgi:hypothetical protein